MSIHTVAPDPHFEEDCKYYAELSAKENAKALRRARDARIGYSFLAFILLLIVLAVAFG